MVEERQVEVHIPLAVADELEIDWGDHENRHFHEEDVRDELSLIVVLGNDDDHLGEEVDDHIDGDEQTKIVVV